MTKILHLTLPTRHGVIRADIEAEIGVTPAYALRRVHAYLVRALADAVHDVPLAPDAAVCVGVSEGADA